MNILPKKRWHVRTKDNIARVRRDEAEAREIEEKRLEKLKIAESEARINFLRRQNGIPERIQDEPAAVINDVPASTSSSHIDLFSDFKTHTKIKNKDLEREKKEQREKYEKQIGYLTYLGQDTNEALKLKSWYEVAPKRSRSNYEDEKEKDPVNKYFNDPLTLIHTFLPPERFDKEPKTVANQSGNLISKDCNESVYKSNDSLIDKTKFKKHKTEKKSKKKKSKKEKKRESETKKLKNKEYIEVTRALVEKERNDEKNNLIDRLRKERLQREAAERERQYELLNPSKRKRTQVKKPAPAQRVKQKYNSQFNPNLAKQNTSEESNNFKNKTLY